MPIRVIRGLPDSYCLAPPLWRGLMALWGERVNLAFAMSRRFQFSLRTLLVALTGACLWLGWKVESARQRGRAIDAVMGEALVQYKGNPDFIVPGTDHFWLDWNSTPVSIIGFREVPPSADIGKQLARIRGLAALDLRDWFDIDLGLIESLDDGCNLVVSDFAAPADLERLQRKLPRCQISCAPRQGACAN